MGGGIDVSAPSADVTIGADGADQKFRLDGDLAEVIAVKGSVSASDLAGIETYLAGKYGL